MPTNDRTTEFINQHISEDMVKAAAVKEAKQEALPVPKLLPVSVWEHANIMRKLNELVKAVNEIYHGISGFDQNFEQIDTNFDVFKGLVTELDEGLDTAMDHLQKVGWGRQQVPVKVQLIHPEATLPTYAKPGDAGMDIYAVEDVTIAPGGILMISTGLRVAIPDGYELQIRPRSGLSAKTYLRVANAPGTIDTGYRGEIKVLLHNTAPVGNALFDDRGNPVSYLSDLNGHQTQDKCCYDCAYIIRKGDRIAQMVLNRVPMVVWDQVEDVTEIAGDRGGGLGHTGK